MKTVRWGGLLAVCVLISWSSAMGAPALTAQEIAENPELVVSAIRGKSVEDSAAIVAQALAAVFSSDWVESKKREHCITLVTYAVAEKGKDAAPMMGIVAVRIPSSWLLVVAATSVVAAGDNSPRVATAILEAVAANAALADSCRAACAYPSTVLLPAEIGIIRGITLPTPSHSPSKAPPLPTFIPKGTTPPAPVQLPPAPKYQGQ